MKIKCVLIIGFFSLISFAGSPWLAGKYSGIVSVKLPEQKSCRVQFRIGYSKDKVWVTKRSFSCFTGETFYFDSIEAAVGSDGETLTINGQEVGFVTEGVMHLKYQGVEPWEFKLIKDGREFKYFEKLSTLTYPFADGTVVHSDLDQND